MKFITVLCLLFLSACTVQVIDMTPEKTIQKYDLLDTEGDGVIQARDECPDSHAGAKVGNNGCGFNAIHTIRRRLDVNFDSNSYKVKEIYIAKVKKLADFMDEFPKVQVSIEGHTSIRGSAKLNKALSKKRAQAIKNMLVEKFNISPDRITTIGYGFEKLLLEGNTEYIHEKNRRIVAEISSDKEMTNMKWTIYSVDNEEE